MSKHDTKKPEWTGIAVRLGHKTIRAFDERSELHGKSRSEMLRELVTAFTEGRIAIRQKPSTQKANEELYR